MNNLDILMVEDEVNLREMFIIILEEEGYNIHSAKDGSEAWDLMQKNSYSLVLTDLYMPKMNGFELIKKAQLAFPDTKVILCSGGGKDLEAVHYGKSISFCGEVLQVDGFLSKPYNLNDMLKKIEELINVSST